MADGKIVIDIIANDKQLKKADRSIKDFTASMLLAKVAQVAFKKMADSVGKAIDRFDTLNQFPKVLQGIGFSAEDSQRAVDRLSDGIQGLPTTLQDIVSNAQQIALITKDIDTAVDITLALNNAFLASSASTEDARRGLDQYTKMLSTGQVDLESWRTMMETMGPALDEVANAMGYTGKTAQMDLYKALQSGEVTFDQFNASLVEADQKLGGFADRALEGSEGIRTSMNNISTAFVTGVEKIIRALDDAVKKATGINIAQNMRKVQMVIADAFSVMARAVEIVGTVFANVFDAISGILGIFVGVIDGAIGIARSLLDGLGEVLIWVSEQANKFGDALIALGTAFAIYKNMEKITMATDNFGRVLKNLSAISKLNTDQMAGFVRGLYATEKASVANTIKTKALTAVMTLYGTVTDLLTGKTTLLAVAKQGLAFATGLVKVAFDLLIAHPLIAVLALLAYGAIKLVQAFMRVDESAQEVIDSSKELNDEIERSIETTERSADAHIKKLEAMEQEKVITEEAVNSVIRLREEEELSSAQKLELADNVEYLNENVEGLNISYDEQTGTLSHTNEQLEAYAELAMIDEEILMRQERSIQLRDEEAEAVENQKELEKQLEAIEKERNETGLLSFKQRKELNEQYDETKGKIEENSEVIRLNGARQVENNEMVAKADAELAEQKAELSRITVESYHQMNDEQKKTFDAMNERTTSLVDETVNNWERLNTEQELTLAEMQENLKHNNDITEQWADDLATLAERGVDEGLLQELREMGPEGAGLVSEFVTASDEELAGLEEEWGRTGKNAKDQMLDELDMSEEDLTPGVYELLGTTTDAWTEGIDSSNLKQIFPDAISEGMKEGAEDMKASGNALADGAVQGIKEGEGDVNKAGSDLGKSADDGFTSSLQIKSPSRLFIQHGKDIIAGLDRGISQGSPKVMRAMTKLGQDMNKAMDTAMNKLTQNNTKSLDSYVKSIQRMASQMESEMRKVSQTIERASNDMSRTMSDFARKSDSSWKDISRTITKASQDVVKELEKSAKAMEKAWANMTRKIESDTRSGFGKMVSTMRTQLSSAERNASTSSRQVASNLRAGVNSATASGRAMGNGFRNGLNSTRSGIMSTAISIANSASNAIKRALKIHSPSRVTYGFGENFGEGFIGGIDSMVSGVSKSGQNLADSALPKINPMAGISKYGQAGVSGSSMTSNHNSSMVVNIEKIENNSDSDIPRILEESAWIMEGQRRGRLNG